MRLIQAKAGTSIIDFAAFAVLNNTNGANYTLNHVEGILTIMNRPPSGTAPRITGPTKMTLQTGYTATSTDAYSITGTWPVSVSKMKGDTCIAWNPHTWQLDIAEGIPAGIYAVELTASNSVSSASFTFTLTVAEKVYYIDIPHSIPGGTVVSATSNPNPFLAVSGQIVTLTATPDEGYEPASISVVNHDNRNIEIPLTGTGNTRTFVMPAHHVSVVATFRPTGNVSIVETDNYPSLSAYVQNGVLYITGTKAGATIRIYNTLGTLIYQTDETLTGFKTLLGLGLPGRGTYIITDGNSVVKVVY